MYLPHTSEEPTSAWYNQKKLWEEQDNPLRLWNVPMGHTFANCLFKTYEFSIPIMSWRKCLLTSTRALLSLTLLVITSVSLNCWSSFLLSFNYTIPDEELIKNIPDCSLTVGVSVILPAVLICFIFWVLTKRSDFLQSSCRVQNRNCAAVAESLFSHFSGSLLHQVPTSGLSTAPQV